MLISGMVEIILDIFVIVDCMLYKWFKFFDVIMCMLVVYMAIHC